MLELRLAERGRSLLKAKIIFNNRMSTVDCVVKNISAGGAKLAVTGSLSLPNEFDLDIPMRGKTYRAQMRWRDSDHIGVEFIDAVATEGAPSAIIHRLQDENARLKAIVQALTKRLADLGEEV